MSQDAEQIRSAARRVGALALKARAAARELESAHGVQWHGVASAAYRVRLRSRAAELRRCAQGLEELQRRLIHHARAVERAEAALERLEDTRDATFKGLERQGFRIPGSRPIHAIGTVAP